MPDTEKLNIQGTLRVQPYTYEKYDAKLKANKTVNEFVVTADSVYKWVNAETPGEYIEVPWALVGQMEDASQAFGAAETYCNRYFLMKSLQLATSEADPDEYRSKQKEAEGYDQEKEQKAAAEELAKAVKEILDKGSELIKKGFAKEEVMAVVGKYNNGNSNPSSIKSIEICAAVMAEFAELEKSKASKKSTTPKGETK